MDGDLIKQDISSY